MSKGQFRPRHIPTKMKTPPSEDLLCAADWVEACDGLDRKRLMVVAEWLRNQASKKLDREMRAKGEIR